LGSISIAYQFLSDPGSQAIGKIGLRAVVFEDLMMKYRMEQAIINRNTGNNQRTHPSICFVTIDICLTYSSKMKGYLRQNKNIKTTYISPIS
jgi:hypothetical protein